jgi:serine/threonine protein kinase
MYKLGLSSGYGNFKEFSTFLKDIKYHFKKSDSSIHKARNELKILSYKDIILVVKAFKIPNILKSIIYTFCSSSKAKRSYQYSLKVGEFAPRPIGYIEYYRWYLLYDSYFISERFDYDFTIREPLIDKSFEDREEIFRQFARFTYELHKRGIFHKDYSPGNILIKYEDEGYLFKIVDINRMKFITFNIKDRLKNFDKLWASDEDLDTIIKEYARLLDMDSKILQSIARKYNRRNKYIKNLKKRLKGIEVVD